MVEDRQDQMDTALRAANLALSGRRHREASRFASIELRFADPRSGPWEALAVGSVAVFAMLIVIAVWLL